MARRGSGARVAILGGAAVVLLAVLCWWALFGTVRRVHVAMNLPPARTLPLRPGPQTPPTPFPRPPS